MKGLKYLVLVLTAGLGFILCSTVTAPRAQAQISINIGVPTVPPNCPYGYYDYAPYACAPYGYYGPEWFVGGAFIGAGPWFHGPAGFHGHVNNRLDVHHGYKGPMPKVGDRPEPGRTPGAAKGFKGNEMRDGKGNVVKGKR